MASSLFQQTVLAALTAGRHPVSLIDGDFNQIITALNTLKTFSNWYVDSGVSNAYVITVPSPQIVSIAAGLPFNIKCGAMNTGASTLSVIAGSTPLPLQNIVNLDGSVLSSGQIVANGISAFVHDGSNFQLLNPASAISGGWVKVGNSIAFGAFSIAGMTKSINLFSLVAGGIITGVKIKHSTSFLGGLIASCTMSVGIAGNLDKYASAFDVFQAVGNTVFSISTGPWSEDNGAATQILLTAVSTGANLSALTAGVVDVWAQISVAK